MTLPPFYEIDPLTIFLNSPKILTIAQVSISQYASRSRRISFTLSGSSAAHISW